MASKISTILAKSASERVRPVGSADIITTTTHKTLRGPRGGMILCTSELARDVNRAVFPNMQGGPLEHVVAAKAVAFGEALTPEFASYQHSVVENAKALADELSSGGLRLVSGGTDNHMVLVDLTPFDITGRQAEEALGRVNVVANRNAIPYDVKPPRVASGVRLGTPACTTRGMGTTEMKRIAQLIIRTITNIEDQAVEREVHDEVLSMAARFPVPGIDR